MIKRRFYRFTHGDKDAPSDSDSSSDSEGEAVAESTDESGSEDEHEINHRVKRGEDSSSGYESEDSSGNEVNLDSSGLPSSDDELAAQNGRDNVAGSVVRNRGKSVLPEVQNSPVKDKIQFDATDCLLKIKSVYKCRLCPRIVCLSEETLKTHLNSKRHARSEKLLKEGRLRFMLNEVGEIEGDSSPERHARTIDSDDSDDSDEEPAKSKKKGKGRREEKKRLRKEKKKAGGSAKNRAKRRSKGQ